MKSILQAMVVLIAIMTNHAMAQAPDFPTRGEQGLFMSVERKAYTNIDPVLLEEMGQRRGDERIKVFVIMRQQYDQQQLNLRAAHFTTRDRRREFVVNELQQFAEASQYDLRHTLAEMQRSDFVSEPKVLWIANAIFFEATRDAILSLADRTDIMVIGFDEERNWLPDGEEARPADPTREITSNVTQVNADQVWNLGYTGQGVVVALIDTGVNYNHLDLADHLWDGGTEFPHHGYDVYNDDNDPIDDHSHGTHCAGTICGDGTAGSQTGMAPDATLMCVKCLSAAGRCNDSHIITAMQWAIAHGCDVISMSLGGHGHSGAEQTLLRNTCVNVLNAGVIASIAAGNEGDKLGSYPIPDNVGLPGGCPPPYLDPEQEQNPGGLSCSVCVGAVNSNDEAAYFTSHGPRDWTESDYADYPYTPGSLTEFGLIRPDVCAPGVSIKSADYSSNTGYTFKDGTSMATPCVAGCMALMLSKNIDATPAELCRILEETAAPLSTGKSNIYGYGRVDVLAAVNAMYSGPLTLDSFTVNDGQGNNDGKLNAGESVMLNLSLTNDSDVALDGATMVFTTESEYVTITNGTATLPHFNAGQTHTINNMFAFTLSDDAPAKRLIHFRAETFVNGESVGVVRIGVMVYGHILKFVEVTVLNDNNGNGMLEAGETANLHVTLCNIGNELASSIVGTLSTTYPNLIINSNNKSFGTIDVNGQASADFNVSLTGSAPESYTIDLSLDLVDANQKHTDVDFELWRKAITLTSNPAEGGTLSGDGYYGQGQTCTITATANPGYVFVKWTLNGSTVSYLSTYTFEITGEAAFVAHFQTVVDGVVIGDGARKNSYLPTTVFNSYALSQQIYTADELNLESCDITSVSFFNTSISFTRDLTVYMVNTSKTAFDSNTDWISVTEDDQVYSGSFTFSGNSWTTIYFDTVFVYDGSSNIALIVDDNSGIMYLYSMPCRVSSTESCQALCAYNLFTNYDAYNPDYSGNQYMEKNQVIFGVAHYDYTVTVSANSSNGGTVNGGGGPYYYGYPITLTATPNEGYVFNNWTKNGEVVSYLSQYNLNVTESAEYVANFQEVTNGFVIGNAPYSNVYLPSYSGYNYTLSQQIYTADELDMDAGEISAMSFFNTGYTMTRNYTVYMVNTDKTVFENNNDWITVTENDQVFSGSVTMTTGTWVTIYFSTPFTYDGSSNLALIVDDNTGTWGGNISCRTFDAEGTQAIRIYSDDINYNPYNPSDYSGTLMSVKNQVIFGIPSYDFTVTASVGPDGGGTVNGGGQCYLNQPVILTATPDEGYVFSNWTKDGEVVSYLSKYILSVTESADYVANFQAVTNGFVVGDATYTNAYLPTYTTYPYSLSQQIYTTDELGGEAIEISSLSFFNTGSANTRNLSIYMVHTDKVAFESNTDWIPVSENDLVFSGSVSLTACGWTTIYFNVPFDYDGTSNVVLVVDDNSNNWNSGLSCRTFDTEGNQALRVFGYSTNFDPTGPSSYTGTLLSVKNQVIFGVPSYDFTVTVTVGSDGGGTVSGGGLCYYGQSVTLIATPNEGYVFSNWTKDGEVVSYLSNYSLSVTESAEYVANFQEITNGFVVGDATYANAILPTYYYYSLTEQIYTANEMGGTATEISSVSFFNTGSYSITRNMSVYMLNTNKTSFEGTSDWIPVSDDYLVFSGNVTFTARGWVTVYFSTPFNYDGSSNVALIVDDNSNSYNSYTSCRTFSADGDQTLRIYGSGTNYDPYAPTDYTGTLMSVKNQVIFGIPSFDYTVTATVGPGGGGTVSGGGPCYLNQPITLTATPNEGYVFSNWTKDGEVVSYLSTYSLSVTESAEYVANFQEVTNGFVVGDATYANAILPTYYYYSLTEQIYTANEMGGTATEISSVSFFNTGSYSITRNMSVYMLNTDKTSFESTSDWIPVSDDYLVFSGNVTFTARGWVTVYFSTPFNYDGSSNVALIVDDNSNSYNSYTSCRTFSADGSQTLRIYGSGTNYDPYDPTDFTGTLMTEKNQVIFGIPSYDYTVTATVGPNGGGTVSGGGLCFLNQPVILTATPDEGYVFSNWTKNGEVVSYLSTYSLSVIESAEYVANFELAPEGILIGDATYTNAYLPTYSYYPYTLSQQIYTADEMGGQATQIYSISFFNTGTAKTRNFTVYLVHTDKTVFETNTDWITVTEADQVFSGDVAMAAYGWTSIIFDVPFSYNGTSNVALIVDDNTGNWNGGLSCRTFNTEGYQAIRVYGSGTNYDPYAPTDYNGTLMLMKNQVIFHWPSTITAIANSTGGGTVSGAGSYAFGATCTLTATPNNGYYFLNWTENGNVVSYDNAYSFTVNGDRNLVANFVAGESICTISFDLYSSWGSGWYGDYLVVDYGNGNTEQLTLSSGSSISYSREVATGSIIALSWIAGSYTYQCSFDVKFENGVLIYHGASLNSNFQQELNINCALATAPHIITAVANPAEGGTVEGAGIYDGGTVITLTATPNDGYTFCYWEENGQQVSTDIEYTFTVTADRDLVARFSLPLTISVINNMPQGGTTTNGGVFYYGNTCTLTASPNEGYLFLNWSKNGEVVSCNATYNFTVTESAEIEAVFMLLEGTLIGQGESTNQYLPSYSYYNYTLSQQIYTPVEIGEAGNITSISYYNGGDTKTRSYDIYMVHTDKTVFDSNADWITVTEADRVYSGSVNMTKGYWTTIALDIPFAYDGTSNLAIIMDDNTGTWSSGMACRVFYANGYQAIRVYSDNTNYDPFNPSEYNGSRYTMKNQIILGFSSTCHFVTAGNWSTASNWSGGTMPGANDEAFIDASCQLDMNATVAALTVTNGQSLTLQSGKTLNVSGTLTNTSVTSLIIEDGAQLISTSANVAATVKKNIQAFGSTNPDGWYTISSPMNGMVIAGSNFLTPSYDLYRFNETNLTDEEWENYKANLADFTTFEKGRGYLYANNNDFTPTFTGILNASAVTYSLTCTNRPNDPLSGFNLIGNPFPHEIYKGAGAAIDNANLASGYYTLTNEGTWQAHTFDDAIQPGQGILVKATAPTVLTIAKSNAEASSESGGAKSGVGHLSISVSGDGGHDRAYVYFGQGVDLDKAKSLDQSVSSLAIRKESGDYAIAHFNKKSDAIELVFTTPESGSVTLNVKADANDFEYLHMVDMCTGADIDLLQQSSYTFSTLSQAGERHFKLVYKLSSGKENQ